MKKFFYLTFLVLTLFIFSGTISAAVVSDLIITPSADILPGKGAISGEIAGSAKRIETLFKIDPRIELGGEVEQWGDYEAELGVLIKIALAEEKASQPGIAGGIKGKDLYLVASKRFKYGIRGHLGIGNGHLGGLFIGINKVFNPVTVEISDGDEVNVTSSKFPPINLMAEYVNQDINLGMRMNLHKDLYFDLSIMDLEDVRAGVSYTF